MIRIAEPCITEQDILTVMTCLKDNQLSGRSPVCKDFEDDFAKKFNVKHAVAVNSGTSALFLAMKALGIGEGDEVIVPAFGFIAIPNAVRHVGATPVFVDVDPNTFNIDPQKIVITEKTKAIIAVHTYGQPCDMDKLMHLGVPVIEDAAEAHGAKYKDRMCGSIGDIGCFSFFANKTITTGEGGMVVTNNPILAKEIRLLKDQYRGDVQFKHDKVGYGMSLGAMQCALGISQLDSLDDLVERKIKMAKLYTRELKGISQLTLPTDRSHGGVHSYWMYALKATGELKEHLESVGIEVRPGFFPLNLQPAYSDGSQFPVSEELYSQIVCLPMNLKMTEQDQWFVINKVKEYYGKHSHSLSTEYPFDQMA
ncbi:DegT/DnrJ/EryC1/StrS family aminotransferase [Candidatus Woesebacteria bacterium]|nr:DegT/DnrJ/EryC1/StrS family aminotransferase [Candidatus Woesebacteria bacterium]